MNAVRYSLWLNDHVKIEEQMFPQMFEYFISCLVLALKSRKLFRIFKKSQIYLCFLRLVE